jgi:hypothetical protein
LITSLSQVAVVAVEDTVAVAVQVDIEQQILLVYLLEHLTQ